ncbi:MAG: hypothetical protein AUH80_06835 [Chloroflexi bacterium 13_1_40CM_4_65_16]|nr:MAG: hypothetical protein AUH80_06835 [Chloroflexi bacterium 13_1_40CM_4_65_16]
MPTLYTWLFFVHVLAVGTFLFAHGVSGGASFLLRGPVSQQTRSLLRLSQQSSFLSSPAILLVIVTGIWMTLAGHWSGRVWPWASLALLIVVFAAMVYVARPYYMARDAMKDPNEAIAARLASAKPMLALWIGVPALVMLSGSWPSNVFDLNTNSALDRYFN